MTPEEMVQSVLDTPLHRWWAYRCDNPVQSVDRLACHIGDTELQINEIKHSNAAHRHGYPMTSLILMGGYTWFLKQDGAAEELELFAAPGSIVRMGTNDQHRIPEQVGRTFLSLCAFDGGLTDWHQHYPKLLEHEAKRLLDAAKFHVRRHWYPSPG
jgi:hypothetical protein